MHYVPLEQTPAVLYHLAKAGLTTREAVWQYHTQYHDLPALRRMALARMSMSRSISRVRSSICYGIR